MVQVEDGPLLLAKSSRQRNDGSNILGESPKRVPDVHASILLVVGPVTVRLVDLRSGISAVNQLRYHSSIPSIGQASPSTIQP